MKVFLNAMAVPVVAALVLFAFGNAFMGWLFWPIALNRLGMAAPWHIVVGVIAWWTCIAITFAVAIGPDSKPPVQHQEGA